MSPDFYTQFLKYISADIFNEVHEPWDKSWNASAKTEKQQTYSTYSFFLYNAT